MPTGTNEVRTDHALKLLDLHEQTVQAVAVLAAQQARTDRIMAAHTETLERLFSTLSAAAGQSIAFQEAQRVLNLAVQAELVTYRETTAIVAQNTEHIEELQRVMALQRAAINALREEFLGGRATQELDG